MTDKNSFNSQTKASAEPVSASVFQPELFVELDDVQQSAIVGGSIKKAFAIYNFLRR